MKATSHWLTDTKTAIQIVLKNVADSLFSSCSSLSAKNGFTQLYFSKDLFPLCYDPHFSWVFNRRACFSKRGREERRFGSVLCGCGSGGLYGSPNLFQSWLLLAAVLSIGTSLLLLLLCFNKLEDVTSAQKGRWAELFDYWVCQSDWVLGLLCCYLINQS